MTANAETTTASVDPDTAVARVADLVGRMTARSTYDETDALVWAMWSPHGIYRQLIEYLAAAPVYGDAAVDEPFRDALQYGVAHWPSLADVSAAPHSAGCIAEGTPESGAHADVTQSVAALVARLDGLDPLSADAADLADRMRDIAWHAARFAAGYAAWARAHGSRQDRAFADTAARRADTFVLFVREISYVVRAAHEGG